MEALGVTELPEEDNYHILLALNTEYLTREGYAKALREDDQTIFRSGFGQQPLTISHAIDLILTFNNRNYQLLPINTKSTFHISPS